MTESRYKSGIEKNVSRLVGQLISGMCGISESSMNYKRAEEFVIYNLQNHSYLNPLYVDVTTNYSNIVEKLRINSQIWKAERLHTLYNKFLKRKLVNPKGVVDLNVRILDLLLKLSTAPLESEYILPKAFERVNELQPIIAEEPEEEVKYSEVSDKSSELSEESYNEDPIEEDKMPSPIAPKHKAPVSERQYNGKDLE